MQRTPINASPRVPRAPIPLTRRTLFAAGGVGLAAAGFALVSAPSARADGPRPLVRSAGSNRVSFFGAGHTTRYDFESVANVEYSGHRGAGVLELRFDPRVYQLRTSVSCVPAGSEDAIEYEVAASGPGTARIHLDPSAGESGVISVPLTYAVTYPRDAILSPAATTVSLIESGYSSTFTTTLTSSPIPPAWGLLLRASWQPILLNGGPSYYLAPSAIHLRSVGPGAAPPRIEVRTCVDELVISTLQAGEATLAFDPDQAPPGGVPSQVTTPAVTVLHEGTDNNGGLLLDIRVATQIPTQTTLTVPLTLQARADWDGTVLRAACAHVLSAAADDTQRPTSQTSVTSISGGGDGPAEHALLPIG